MSEEGGLLETVSSEVIERGPGGLIDRLAPMSVGAVAGGAVLVAAAAVVRTLFGRSRLLKAAGAIAAIPLGLWVLNNAADSLGISGDEEDVDENGAGGSG